MYDVVDMFVIAESTRTFQGDTKPLHLTNSNLSWLENDPCFVPRFVSSWSMICPLVTRPQRGNVSFINAMHSLEDFERCT